MWYQGRLHWAGLVGFGISALASVVSLQVEYYTSCYAECGCIHHMPPALYEQLLVHGLLWADRQSLSCIASVSG